MSISSYPPQLEGKIAAFAVDEGGSTKVTIPYVLNKAISLNDFTHMSIMIKAVTTGAIKWTGDTSECKLYNSNLKSYYSIFTIPHSAFTPIAGNYYKIQLAFKNGNNRSNWSSTAVIKCTHTPSAEISSLTAGIDNINPSIYLGSYINKDVTEKLYSYKFIIYDENNKVYEASDELIHNGSTDEIISGVGIKATVRWQPTKLLPESTRHRIAMEITTINGYKKSSILYIIRAASTVDAKIPARLLATPDYDNGCVNLSLIKLNDIDNEIAFSGNFVISRYVENTNTWNEICRFNMLSQTPSDIGRIWTDYTIEHGVKYLYALQAYNSKQLYSNRMYHVLANPDVYSKTKYLEYDELGKPYYIVGDFEDMFLTDGNRQLKIKYNPKVSSYKPTILESKIDTLGSKYPFIFRNGNVNYKEFPISGLLSYLGDEKELFMTGVKPPEDSLTRSRTSAAAGLKSRQDWLSAPDSGTKLTSDNFYRERQFKMAALEWLTDGLPKLFRSPSEGNYIVRLMNASLTPNEQVGRMLHTFNTTAYEIADCSFENLQKYNLLASYNEENRTMKFAEVKLSEVAVNDVYAPGYNMYHVYITEASPGTQYTLGFNELTENNAVTYTIGITGSLYMDIDSYPIASIAKVEGDVNNTAMLHYGYYDTSVPDNFSCISKITSKDEIIQLVGYDDSKNVIEDKLEDVRREVGHFYSIVIRPRPIISLYSYNGKFYRDDKHINEVLGGWMDTAIYYIVNENIYYSGQPRAKSLGSTLPEQYFKLNDLYIIDLATGNAYLSTDPIANSLSHNPQAGKYFSQLTHGSYAVTGDFGTIHSLHMSTGVYIEACYELKEIEYSVEETNEDVISAKEAWLTAKALYEASESAADYAAMMGAYNTYIYELEEAIENAEMEEGYYAL